MEERMQVEGGPSFPPKASWAGPQGAEPWVPRGCWFRYLYVSMAECLPAGLMRAVIDDSNSSSSGSEEHGMVPEIRLGVAKDRTNGMKCICSERTGR